jgi:hypothetical protein
MLDIKLPSIHCRVLYPPKDKKLKNFYFYCKAIIKNKKNFFIYSEVANIKNMIEKKLLYNVDITTGVYSFNVKRRIYSMSKPPLHIRKMVYTQRPRTTLSSSLRLHAC